MRLRMLVGACLNSRLLSHIPLPILLQELTAKGRTLENGLDQVVLLQRLRQVLVHLCLDAFLAITHHGVGCQSNNGSTMRAQAALVLTNLACCLKTALLGWD